jgi:AraC-like DNA-binding protein
MHSDQQNASNFDQLGTGDWARFWRDGRFDNMECLHARFRNHSFAPHTHDTYVVGVLVDGIEEFFCRGAVHRAGAGAVLLINPLEVHDGKPVTAQGFAYRMLYPSEALLQNIAEDMGDRSTGPPRFASILNQDAVSYAAIVHAHSVLEATSDPLSRETALLRAMAVVITRHAETTRPLVRADLPRRRLQRALDLIEARMAEPLDLAQLAEAAGLGRFQLIRAFRRHFGLTPAAYLTDRRVIRARQLLGEGLTPVEVAASAGFCDQSHLNRAFKARVGVTPGQYRTIRNPIQDRAALPR